MNSAFLLLLVVSLSTVAAGIAFALVRMHNAPEGYEDQDGFHFGRQPVPTPVLRSNHFSEQSHVEAA